MNRKRQIEWKRKKRNCFHLLISYLDLIANASMEGNQVGEWINLCLENERKNINILTENTRRTNSFQIISSEFQAWWVFHLTVKRDEMDWYIDRFNLKSNQRERKSHFCNHIWLAWFHVCWTMIDSEIWLLSLEKMML